MRADNQLANWNHRKSYRTCNGLSGLESASLSENNLTRITGVFGPVADLSDERIEIGDGTPDKSYKFPCYELLTCIEGGL